MLRIFTKLFIICAAQCLYSGTLAGQTQMPGEAECASLDFSWRAAPAIAPGRYYHTATLLPDGQLLVTGGRTGFTPLRSTMLFDPHADNGRGTWQQGPLLGEPRERHTATLLPVGWVILTGGIDQVPSKTARIYDSNLKNLDSLPPMQHERYEHTATSIGLYKVVVMGSKNYDKGLASCEILESLDVVKQKNTKMRWRWRLLPPMQYGRGKHRATKLSNREILITGGVHEYHPTPLCEIFDPSSETWRAAPSMYYPREGHTATALPDGRVIVTGGDVGGLELKSCELFTPWENGGQGKWELLPEMIFARKNHSATLVNNRYLIVAGAWRVGHGDLACEVLDVQNMHQGWKYAPLMLEYRSNHSATLLQDGRLLLVGGELSGNQLGTSACDITDRTLDIENFVSGIADGLEIQTVYPNPSDGRVSFMIDCPNNSALSISIHNILGQEVYRISSPQSRINTRSITWNGQNQYGQTVSTGMYVLRVSDEDRSATRIFQRM